MKKVLFALLLCLAATRVPAQDAEKEKVVRAYYSGFENHDWKAVAGQFAEGFTFTSPNNDDHISIEQFKEKCWGTNKFFKKINLIKMTQSGNDLFLLVEIITTDDKVVRNVTSLILVQEKLNQLKHFLARGNRTRVTKNNGESELVGTGYW